MVTRKKIHRVRPGPKQETFFKKTKKITVAIITVQKTKTISYPLITYRSPQKRADLITSPFVTYGGG